jgi:hypothetical protein
MKNALHLAVLLVPLILLACSQPRPVAYYPPPPPPAFTQVARQGFRDGAAAARRDIRAGLPPDVGRHPRFRNPPVPPPALEDYRHGFREGYDRVIHPGPPPPPPGD